MGKFKVGDEVVLVDCRLFNGAGKPEFKEANQPSWASECIGQVYTIVGFTDSFVGVVTDREVPHLGKYCFEDRFVLKNEYKPAIKKNKWVFCMKGAPMVRFEIEAPNRKQAFEKFVEYIGYEEV